MKMCSPRIKARNLAVTGFRQTSYQGLRAYGNRNGTSYHFGVCASSACVWRLGDPIGVECASGQCTHAGNCGRHSRGRGRLSQAPIYDDCGGRCGRRGHSGHRIWQCHCSAWLCHRCHDVGARGFRGHVCFGTGKCSHDRGVAQGFGRRPGDRVQVGRIDRHAGRGARAACDCRILRRANGRLWSGRQ